MNTDTSSCLFDEAREYIPGGVDSPVRAMKGVMLTMFCSEGTVRSFAQTKQCDLAAYAAYRRHMLEAGVYLAPSQFEATLISLALSDADIDQAAAAAAAWFAGAEV